MKPSHLRGSARLVGAVTTVMLVAGTAGCERDDRPPPEAEAVNTQVSLFNATHEVLALNVRTVDSDYAVDCQLATARPDAYLDDEHLTGGRGLAEQIDEQPFSGVELPFPADDQIANTGDDCRFAVVEPAGDDDRLPPAAVHWPRDLPQKTIYPDVDAPRELPPEPQTIVVEADYTDVDDDRLPPWRDRPCGGDLSDCSQQQLDEILSPIEGVDYSWEVLGDEPSTRRWEPVALDERPGGEPDDAGCRTGRDTTPLSWDSPPTSGIWRLESLEETTVDIEPRHQHPEPDDDVQPTEWDCYDLELSGEDRDRSWQFCGSELVATRIASEQFDGEVLLDFFAETAAESSPNAYELLTLDIERRTDDGTPFERETIEAIRGHAMPEHLGLEWRAEPATACEPVVELPGSGCNQVSLPGHLIVDVGGEDLRIRPGEIEALDLQADRRLEYVRGLSRAVVDLQCRDDRLGPDHMTAPGPYMEFVHYSGASSLIDTE